MNLNKLTLKSQEALQNAQEIASSYGNQVLEPDHLLAALVQDTEGTVVPVLQKIGVNLSTLKIKINAARAWRTRGSDRRWGACSMRRGSRPAI
jgi:ATP-dependent Clp protease ATP-binding subunit ClpB